MAVSPAHGVQCGGDAHKGTHVMFIFEPHVLYANQHSYICRPRLRGHSDACTRASRSASVVPVSNNNLSGFSLIIGTAASATLDSAAPED